MKKITLTIIFLLIPICLSFGNTWKVINEKTWISNTNFPTSQYVFYETSNGFKKAIFQINGSGRCAVLSLIYDVELEENTIFLKNELNLDSSLVINREREKASLILYLKNDSIIISNDLSIEYKMVFDNARICNWLESYSGYQIIPIDELKAIPLEKNQIYDIHFFNLGPNPINCGIDNNSELTDIEAIFLSEYIKSSAYYKGFDFHNKKHLGIHKERFSKKLLREYLQIT